MGASLVLNWIVGPLGIGLTIPLFLPWYWWRFNGNGFFWGMVGGLVPALTFRFIFTGVLDLYTFPLMLLISLIACFIGTYTAPPVNEDVLRQGFNNIGGNGAIGATFAYLSASYAMP